ncbi:MAG: cytochrome c, class I [Pseudomonadota bacterium]
MSRLLLLPALFAASSSIAEINPDRAQFHYRMHCQGCHMPDGSGASDVPQMKGQIGKFLRTQEGREYLVRVPGSALSALEDDELAELLNWILREMGETSLPDSYNRYTSAEVGKFRQRPLNEVEAHREKLVTDIEHLTESP